MDDMPRFKCLLVGSGGVGKTSFVRRHIAGEFNRRYVPTMGMNIHPMQLETTRGSVLLDVCDTAGQERFGVLRDGYYKDADMAIIMFDVTSRITYKDVPRWYNDITRVCGPDIPIVLVGNKVDVQHRTVKTKQVNYHTKKGISYVEISAKTNLNFDVPFVTLLRRLLGDDHLALVEAPELRLEEEV